MDLEIFYGLKIYLWTKNIHILCIGNICCLKIYVLCNQNVLCKKNIYVLKIYLLSIKYICWVKLALWDTSYFLNGSVTVSLTVLIRLSHESLGVRSFSTEIESHSLCKTVVR